MNDFWPPFCLGWACGAVAMWVYFLKVRLIRTRREWHADPKIQERYGDNPWNDTDGP